MFHTANTIFNLQVSCIQYTFTYTNNTSEVLIAKVEDISVLKLIFPDLFRWTSWLCLFHYVLPHLPSTSITDFRIMGTHASSVPTQACGTACFRKWYKIWSNPNSLLFSFFSTVPLRRGIVLIFLHPTFI